MSLSPDQKREMTSEKSNEPITWLQSMDIAEDLSRENAQELRRLAAAFRAVGNDKVGATLETLASNAAVAAVRINDASSAAAAESLKRTQESSANLWSVAMSLAPDGFEGARKRAAEAASAVQV